MRLSVGFTPMLDSRNEERLSIVIEANAIVAHAQSELGRIDTLEPFYVAFSGCGKMGKSVKNS
jgi:hypothetical protein